jgi:hypothetical protein
LVTKYSLLEVAEVHDTIQVRGDYLYALLAVRAVTEEFD